MNVNIQIHFELTGPAWMSKLDTYYNLREQHITDGHKFVKENICKDARLARNGRGPLGVWVPAGTTLPKNAWLVSDRNAEGTYYRPRNNTKLGKKWIAKLAALGIPPECEDFVKEHMPGFEAVGLVKDWLVRSSMGIMLDKYMVSLPNTMTNREATPLPGMVALSVDDVLSLYARYIVQMEQAAS